MHRSRPGSCSPGDGEEMGGIEGVVDCFFKIIRFTVIVKVTLHHGLSFLLSGALCDHEF